MKTLIWVQIPVSKYVHLLGLLFLVACDNSANLDQASVNRGERLANNCKPCHSLSDSSNQMGPSLFRVLGRKAGKVEGFGYSEGLLQSEITWDQQTLTTFIQKPQELVPGTNMASTGATEQDAKDIVSYILYLDQ